MKDKKFLNVTNIPLFISLDKLQDKTNLWKISQFLLQMEDLPRTFLSHLPNKMLIIFPFTVFFFTFICEFSCRLKWT